MEHFPKKQTTISSWATVVVNTIASYGHNPDPALEAAGIDKKLLTDPDARISAESMSLLWQEAVGLTGDPGFGLKAALNVRPTTFHALGFALMVSSSMNDALERLHRFYRIVSDVIEMRYASAQGAMEIYLDPADRPPQQPEEAFDMIVATVVSFTRMLIDSELRPLKVELIRKKPARPEEFKAFFKAPVLFNQDHNRIFFHQNDMQKPLQAANAEIAQRNDQIVVEYLARFDKSRISHLAHAKLIKLLPSGEPSIEKLAESMGMTPRSLHRHLRKENVGYRDILDSLRQNLAVQYLKQRHLSVIDVAFQLGYSDSSNFTRAFKRWFRVSPSQYRQQQN
jgi:AraC-like DNA-binding protein